MKKRYKLGNCLRGHAEGNFSSMEEALFVLSRRFLISFPSKTGRRVQMYVKEENPYGFKEFMTCFEGTTSLECDMTDEEVLKRCDRKLT